MTNFPSSEDWHGCYGTKWSREITPESTGHPAKFSRMLIRRIYSWLLENNYLKSGDTVLDPFGGVALGASDALRNGLLWYGIELEQPFVDLGNGCDCTGISKEDWVRFYGRWERMRYGNGRHWCPQCLAEAKMVLEGTNQLNLFDMSAQTAAYRQNSGKIPFTQPHHYEGNISRFSRFAQNRSLAKLLQGDSRELIKVLNTRTDGVITSPPFAGNSGGRGEASRNGIDSGLFDRHQGAMVGGIGDKANGNLASMQAKDGDFQAVVSSPLYLNGCSHQGGNGSKPEHIEGRQFHGEGDLDAMITSPPYVESLASDDPDKRGGLFKDPKRRNDKALTATYGLSSGQVGAMEEGDFEGVVTSPPYENSVNQSSGTADLEMRKKRLAKAGIDTSLKANVGGPNGVYTQRQTYGNSAAQLGGKGGDTFWSAARVILDQSYRALKPGSVAVFVTKDFVKNGERVPFTKQWAQLCEAVGFRPEVRFRAWVVEAQAGQYSLNGDLVIKKKDRKSFFRRLAEKNGSPPIDWEDVLVFRKISGDQIRPVATRQLSLPGTYLW